MSWNLVTDEENLNAITYKPAEKPLTVVEIWCLQVVRASCTTKDFTTDRNWPRDVNRLSMLPKLQRISLAVG